VNQYIDFLRELYSMSTKISNWRFVALWLLGLIYVIRWW